MARQRGTKVEINDKKRQFGMWLGLPASVRDPKTQSELALVLEVSEPTLAHLHKDVEVLKSKESAVKLLGGNAMYEIVQTITKKAKEGSFQHARLYMEWQGEIGKTGGSKDRVEINLTYGDKANKVQG